MEKVKLFFSILLVVSILKSVNIIAQSESSAIKEISPGNVQVTEPMIAVNPADPNNFITVYSNWYGITRRPASSNTTDGGLSWNSTEVPEHLLKYPVDQADPVVAFDADGNAHFCYLDIGDYRDISVAHSTNGGASWTDTSRAYDDFLQQINGFPKPDKPWIVADCNSNSAYKNTLYVVFTAEYELSNSTGYAIFLTYKRPEMPYFSTPIRVCETVIQSDGHDVQGAFPVVGKDGTLYIFWSLESPPSTPTSGYGPASIYMRKSTNGGASFTTSQPVLIKSNITESQGVISFQKAHSWPYVAVNPVDGSLNLVYGDGNTVKYSVSTDKGVSWSTSVPKDMKPSGIDAIWNPNITCNSDGKLAVVFYASNSSGIKVYVATGFSNDGTFTVWDQGSANFSSPYKYTDYIGIACNDYTYLGVWPAPYLPTSKSKIFGRHRTIEALVENLDQDHQQLDNSKVYFDGGTAKTSPYSTATNLFPGKIHTLKIYSPSIIKNGSTYNFYQWEDENGILLSTDPEISVPIDNHKYRAMFNYQAPPPPQSVTVYIKNEFNNPDNTILNGGTINVDNEDIFNTENLPGQQVTKTYLQGDHHRLEAKEQTYPVESFYRGFNTFPQYDGGWLKIINSNREYNSVINPAVQNGTYTAKYRNRYNAQVNGNAPESNGFILNISPTKQIWQYESDYIFAPPTQPFSSGLTGIFSYWADGILTNPRSLTPTNNVSYTSVYKYPQRSNLLNAFNSNSQRKYVKTDDGCLHLVYESMGTVWYETSIDNGVTWILQNNGNPLSTAGKQPSMDINSFIDPMDNVTYYQVVIVWQEQDGNASKIKIGYFYRTANFGSYMCFMGTKAININSNYSSENCTPVIGLDNDNNFKIVFRKSASSSLLCQLGSIYTEAGITLSGSPVSLTGTTGNSINPSLAVLKQSHPGYKLVWEEVASTTNSAIMFGTLSGSQLVGINNASNTSPYPLNFVPSISFANQTPIISWTVGVNTGGVISSRRAATRVNYWGSMQIAGTNVNYVNNNSANNTTEKSVISWSEGTTNPICKWMRRNSGIYAGPYGLGKAGIQSQVCNGSDLPNMSAMAFNIQSTPYYFSKSTLDFSQYYGEEIGPGLNKITENDTIVTFGRSGVASINDIEFVFEIGDILVGDSTIRFIEIPDTLIYNTTSEINQHTRTNNFTLTPTTNFYFSNIYHVVQKSNPDTALTTTDAVNFKVELVNAITNQVVGTFDNVTYSKNNLEKYASIDYEVDCSGIITGDYYLTQICH